MADETGNTRGDVAALEGTAAVRKAYVRPELVEFGHVLSLTRGGSQQLVSDPSGPRRNP